MARLGIIGATGAVGQECLSVLEGFGGLSKGIEEVRLYASGRSRGMSLKGGGKELEVEALETIAFEELDIAIFAVGNELSKEYVKKARETEGATTVIIDNSSAFRMEEHVPLVVPEVNGEILRKEHRLIANPNCSTAQLVMALMPLHREAGLERVVVSTYQSASGAGKEGVLALLDETREVMEGLEGGEKGQEIKEGERLHHHRLAFNVIPHIDRFEENGYTREELKLVNESRKILGIEELEISATAVRVPVLRGHSEAVTVDLARELSRGRVIDLLKEMPGVRVMEGEEDYPTALEGAGNDFTWVGRIRLDVTRPKTVHFWVVSDNLRKGAATNALQIAEAVLKLQGK